MKGDKETKRLNNTLSLGKNTVIFTHLWQKSGSQNDLKNHISILAENWLIPFQSKWSRINWQWCLDDRTYLASCIHLTVSGAWWCFPRTRLAGGSCGASCSRASSNRRMPTGCCRLARQPAPTEAGSRLSKSVCWQLISWKTTSTWWFMLPYCYLTIIWAFPQTNNHTELNLIVTLDMNLWVILLTYFLQYSVC